LQTSFALLKKAAAALKVKANTGFEVGKSIYKEPYS